jgi:hypothetical protein
MTNGKPFRDTFQAAFSYLHNMRLWNIKSPPPKMSRNCLRIASALAIVLAHSVMAQNSPLLSGGIGLLTQTNGGNTTYIPTIQPVFELPITDRFLIEAKANLLETAFPRPHQGYDTSHFVALAYLQGDLQATAYTTITGGYFYTPFNTFIERLSPLWINNFTDGPLISSIGVAGPSGSGLGGMIRGNAYQSRSVSITYDSYFAARSSSEQFPSKRLAGGRIAIFFPKAGLEAGTSFNRMLQGNRSNNAGVHLWWTPPDSRFRFRSEYARAAHAQGYWIELASQLTDSGESAGALVRFEPVFRFQQTFRSAFDTTDGLPAVNTQRADFGLDYRLKHEVRLNTSYSRRFSSTENVNIWETGLTYRFVFPAWRSR